MVQDRLFIYYPGPLKSIERLLYEGEPGYIFLKFFHGHLATSAIMLGGKDHEIVIIKRNHQKLDNAALLTTPFAVHT